MHSVVYLVWHITKHIIQNLGLNLMFAIFATKATKLNVSNCWQKTLVIRLNFIQLIALPQGDHKKSIDVGLKGSELYLSCYSFLLIYASQASQASQVSNVTSDQTSKTVPTLPEY